MFRPDTDDLIAFLNELLKLDHSAISALVAHRVLCNRAMASHPTVQVAEHDGCHSVGLLGIVNGYTGVDERGYGPITAVMTDAGILTRFERTVTKGES